MNSRQFASVALMAAILSLLIARPVTAAAWAQPAGHTYAKISGIFYNADEIYNDMGRRSQMGIDDDEFDGRQMFLYVEYGLRERLTLVTQVNAGVLTDEDNFVRMETTGIGDLDLGLKYQLVDNPFVLSPMLSIKIPTGYNEDYNPALGTGKFDVSGQLLVSRSLYPLPLYAGVQFGYRLRGGAFSNQWSWLTEVGATPHARVFAKVFAAQTSTLVSSNDEDIGVVGGSTQVSEGDFTNLGVNLAVEIVSGLWLDGLLEKTVDGENIGAGMSWGIGLSVSR